MMNNKGGPMISAQGNIINRCALNSATSAGFKEHDEI
jgi:hypothetical protein